MHNRSRHLLITTTLFATMLTATNAWAMRCGNRLINKGDSQAKVLKYCGEPIQKSERFVLRSGTYLGNRSGITVNGDDLLTKNHYYSYGQIEVLLEEWTYNFGPNKLMRRVIFADGIVDDVKTLEYGFHEENN